MTSDYEDEDLEMSKFEMIMRKMDNTDKVINILGSEVVNLIKRVERLEREKESFLQEELHNKRYF